MSHDGEVVFGQSFMPHLIELRRRLLICVVFFVTMSFCAYLFNQEIITFLAKPLLNAHNGPKKLIFTGLTEAFVTFVKVSCFVGCLLSMPFIVFQIWFFVSPGLYIDEKRAFRPFVFMSIALFFFGIAFAYYFVLPNAWEFFLNFQNPSVGDGVVLSLEARVSEYVSLSMQILLAFSFCFQMPALLLVLGRVGVLSYKMLARSRRYIFLLILVVSAILTPPDVLSMIALSCPLYGLFEVALLLIRRIEKKRDAHVDSPDSSSVCAVGLSFEE